MLTVKMLHIYVLHLSVVQFRFFISDTLRSEVAASCSPRILPNMMKHNMGPCSHSFQDWTDLWGQCSIGFQRFCGSIVHHRKRFGYRRTSGTRRQAAQSPEWENFSFCINNVHSCAPVINIGLIRIYNPYTSCDCKHCLSSTMLV